MNNSFPSVSIIVACRNEQKYIGKCLDSLISQDYPEGKIEIIVADGISNDGTREVIANYARTHSRIKLLDNPRKITPVAFNLGIKNSKGEIIILMGVHTVYQKEYISKCVEHLEKYKADNVGGVSKILPSLNNLIVKAIAFSLSSPFGGGDAYYKTSSPKEPRWVDTVFGGCYRKEVFERIGLFNENLKRSQDMEFNLRLKRAGGKILLAPDIISYYYPKSNLKDFFLHNIEDGIWAIYPLKFIKTPLKLRHYIPLIFVLSLPLSIWPYILISLFFSAQIVFREKDFRLFFIMPIIFAVRHFSYGFGSIWGLIKLFQ